MINIKKALYLTIFCTFFWCVLHESFTPEVILSGFLLSAFIVLFHQRFLSLSSFLSYQLPISVFLCYPFLLLWQIIKSSLQTAGIVLKNQAHPAIVMVPTRLQNEWYRTIVANSITLTPGTVSVDFTRNHYIVLWIAPEGKTAEDYYKQIAEPFENLLLKGDADA